MPYGITRTAGATYRVVNKDTGKIKAYGTSYKKAKAQIRLLNGFDNGTIPRKKFKKGVNIM